MKKSDRKYYFILGFGLLLIIIIQISAPKPVNWNLSFSKNDKIPYGCFVTYDYLQDLFPEKQIQNASFPVFNTLKNKEATNYLFINNEFDPDKLDTRELLEFVKEGNNAFIAANFFSGDFADTLNLQTRYYFYYQKEENDSGETVNNYSTPDSTVVNFTNEKLRHDSGYYYKKGLSKYHFTQFDTARVTVLGKDQYDNVNFITLNHGKGKIYLNTLPRAFTNYFMVEKDKIEYAEKALSYLPPAPTIWDEYYKAGRRYIRTPLRFILSEPALKTAYWIMIAALLLHVFFNTKRKQRVIPVIKPLQNTSLKFVDVVGTLYFQTRNHGNIARKKATYFLEFARSRYRLSAKELDEAFISQLSQRSGVEIKEVRKLINFINALKTKISESELKRFNELLNTFHQKRKR